ncbi:MAG: hypothetical protein HY438_04320 [DPANN group archaeon]|nr:hypothetical protein [DPANN group archaeon]
MRLTDVKAISTVAHDGRPAIAVQMQTAKSEAWAELPAAKPVEQAVLINSKAKKFSGVEFLRFEDLKKFNILPHGPALIAVQAAALNLWSGERGRPLWKLLNPNSQKISELFVNVGRTSDVAEILLRMNKDTETTSVFSRASALNLSGLSAFEAIRRVERSLNKTSGHSLGVDLEAHKMLKSDRYIWKNFNGTSVAADAKKHAEMVSELVHHFDIKYIEDPLHKDAFREFAGLHKKLMRYGHRHVCGDHLIRGDLSRAKVAQRHGSVNAILVDLEKAGSILNAKRIFDFCRASSLTPVVNITSNTTANLALGWQAPVAKASMAGLNELAKAEQNL